MDTERQVHSKEFNATMVSVCFNECISSLASSNLTSAEGKCMKQCYITFSKKLMQTGKGFGYEVALNHNLKI